MGPSILFLFRGESLLQTKDLNPKYEQQVLLTNIQNSETSHKIVLTNIPATH